MDIKCGRQKETVHVLNKAGASKKKTNKPPTVNQSGNDDCRKMCMQ